jgi:hypothetical protein
MARMEFLGHFLVWMGGLPSVQQPWLLPAAAAALLILEDLGLRAWVHE